MFITGMVALILLLMPMQASAIFDNWRAQRAYDNKEYAVAQQLLANNPTVNAQFNLADAHYRAGDLKSAAQAFEQLAASNDERIQQQALFNYGNALAHQKEYKKALEQYEKLLQQNVSDAMKERAEHNRDIVKKLLEEQEKKDQEQKKDQQQQEQKQQQENNQDQQQNKQQQNSDNKNDKNDQQQDKQQHDKNNDKQKQDQSQKPPEKPSEKEKKEQQKQDEQRKQQGEKNEEQSDKKNEKKQEKEKQEAAAGEQDPIDKKMHPQLRALLKEAEAADERGAKELMKQQVTAMPQKEGQKNW